MLLNFRIPSVPNEYQTFMKNEGYNQTYIEAAWKFHYIMDNIRKSPQLGQAVLAYCTQKGYSKPLQFQEWVENTIIAKNNRNTEFAVIGSYWYGRYVLRGIVKRRSKRSPFRWLINGQASQGSIQVKHIGESDQVEFPQLQEITQNYLDNFTQRNTTPA